MKLTLLLITTSIISATALAQRPTPIPPGIRQADKAEAQFEKNVPPPVEQLTPVDMAKLKRDADQLAGLANSIPSDIESVQKGMLPKEVIEKLRQVEKLSKRLRSQLTH